MTYNLKTHIIPPPSGTLLSKIKCPNSYYAPPTVIELERMPPSIAELMNSLWSTSIHLGKAISIYSFKNVFVANEGLVFSEDARLIDCTRTLHSDEQIDASADAIRVFQTEGDIRVIPKAVLAKSRGAENYGHFIIEMLTRAWLARTHLNLRDWPALLHKNAPALQKVSIQALNQAGYNSDQISICGHDPVFVYELIYVDGLTQHTQYMSPYVMQCLDEISYNIQASSATKIYAPRRPASSRDFVDEAKLAASLANDGFLEVETAVLNFEDQIAAFKGARTVVGVMGAALTNIAFCKPGTDVFLFMPSSAAEVLFWMISQARRLNYYEIRTKETGPQMGNLPWDRAIEISADELTRIVTSSKSAYNI